MITLLGYYGFGNLGDELLLTACLESLTRVGLPRENIIVLSNDPELTRENFHVKSVNRWRFSEVFHALRMSHSLILGGGGLFQDVTSVKSCIYYWGVVRLARFLGVRVFALGQSIGPLNSGFAKRLAGNALSHCEKIQVRDENSLRLAESLSHKKVESGSDIVMTLSTACESLKHESLPHDFVVENVVEKLLVNLRPCRDLEKFAEIIKPHVNHNYVGVALSSDDESALKLLPLERVVRVKNFCQARELWANASSAIGMRLHFGVLSRIFGTPLALMPYDVKVSEFARQSGVPLIRDTWCEPVKPLEVPEDLCSQLDRLTREIIN